MAYNLKKWADLKGLWENNPPKPTPTNDDTISAHALMKRIGSGANDKALVWPRPCY